MPLFAIEDVVGVVRIVKKGERNGRLGVGIDIDACRVYVVLLQELAHVLAHSVASGFGYECGVDSGTSQRDYSVER